MSAGNGTATATAVPACLACLVSAHVAGAACLSGVRVSSALALAVQAAAVHFGTTGAMLSMKWRICVQSNDASNDFFLALAKVNDRVVAGEYYRWAVTLARALRTFKDGYFLYRSVYNWIFTTMQFRAYESVRRAAC